MLKYGHKKPRSKIRFFQIGNAFLHQADLLRRSRTSWNISADSRLCQRPFWRWEADGFVPILNCTILTTNAWAHVFGVRLSRLADQLILMKIWTDLTWNSVDNLIIRRAIWWTEALPDLWTGLATQCPAENTVIHESYWHMDVDRYTVYIIQCIL